MEGFERVSADKRGARASPPGERGRKRKQPMGRCSSTRESPRKVRRQGNRIFASGEEATVLPCWERSENMAEYTGRLPRFRSALCMTLSA